MAAARKTEEEDIVLVHHIGYGIDGILDVLTGKAGAAGLSADWIGFEIRSAEFREKQIEIIFFGIREHIFNLIETVVAPGVKPDEKRTVRIFRFIEKRRLKRAVEGGFHKYFGLFHNCSFEIVRVIFSLNLRR